MTRAGPEGELPPLRVAPCGGRGRGVFAAAPIAPGALVLRFAGAEVPEADVLDHSRALRRSRASFLSWSGGVDDLVNHSCDPNCGLHEDADGLCLTALRSIAVGAEITFDYSTSMSREPAWSPCLCGAVGCRGRVTDFADLPPDLRATYLARRIVPSYVLDERVAAPPPCRMQLRR